MQFSNRGPQASGYGLRVTAFACIVATFALALIANAQRGANAQVWFEGARLIVGDGTTIDNAAFLVVG